MNYQPPCLLTYLPVYLHTYLFTHIIVYVNTKYASVVDVARAHDRLGRMLHIEITLSRYILEIAVKSRFLVKEEKSTFVKSTLMDLVSDSGHMIDFR